MNFIKAHAKYEEQIIRHQWKNNQFIYFNPIDCFIYLGDKKGKTNIKYGGAIIDELYHSWEVYENNGWIVIDEDKI